MAQDNIAFYTLNHTFTNLTFKQKSLFSSPSQMYKTFQNPEHIKNNEKAENKRQDLVNHYWQPKLPSKKLIQQPKFFISLERKKYRLINAMVEKSQFKTLNTTVNVLQGKKITSKNKSLKRAKNDEALPTLINKHESLQKYVLQERVGWQSNNRTPFLNFNMQYVIKKRKKMFSLSPQKTQKNDNKIATIRFNQQINNK